MRNVIFLILIALAYISGYFTPKTEGNNEPALVSVESVELTTQAQISETPTQTSESVALTEYSPVTKVDKKFAVETEAKRPLVDEPIPATNTQPSATPVVADGRLNAAAPRPLTNEQIDQLLPAPFNQYLKGHDATMLEKYRKFSELENPSRQDTNIQNKIADSIASNPYSKFLTIESLQCKANLCEIRLYENKLGVWSYIQSEMRLQDWWKFHSSSAQGFGVGKENVNGWYVLLTP